MSLDYELSCKVKDKKEACIYITSILAKIIKSNSMADAGEEERNLQEQLKDQLHFRILFKYLVCKVISNFNNGFPLFFRTCNTRTKFINMKLTIYFKYIIHNAPYFFVMSQ